MVELLAEDARILLDVSREDVKTIPKWGVCLFCLITDMPEQLSTKSYITSGFNTETE